MITIDDDGEYLHIYHGDKYIKTPKHSYKVKFTNVNLSKTQYHYNQEYQSTTSTFKGELYDYH